MQVEKSFSSFTEDFFSKYWTILKNIFFNNLNIVI